MGDFDSGLDRDELPGGWFGKLRENLDRRRGMPFSTLLLSWALFSASARATEPKEPPGSDAGDDRPRALITLSEDALARLHSNQTVPGLDPCPYVIEWPIQLAPIDPSRIVRRMILEGITGTLTPSGPLVLAPVPGTAFASGPDPARAAGFSTRTTHLSPPKRDTDRAAADSPQPMEVVLTELYQDGDSRPLLTVSSYAAFTLDSLNSISDGVVAIRNVANLRGTAIVSPGLLATKGTADFDVVRQSLSENLTFVAFSGVQAYVVHEGVAQELAIAPSASVGLEASGPGGAPAVVSLGGGPLMRSDSGTRMPSVGPSMMANFEVLLF